MSEDERKLCPIFQAAQISRLGVGNENAPESFFCGPGCAWYDEVIGACGLIDAIKDIAQAIAAHLK